TVVWWTSSAVAIARSVQPGPASPWLALSRMRAWVRVRAGALPWLIRVWSRARSSSDRTTTYCLRTLGSSSVGILGCKEHRPNPRITQITTDELLVPVGLRDASATSTGVQVPTNVSVSRIFSDHAASYAVPIDTE